jgi:hypothetical protein
VHSLLGEPFYDGFEHPIKILKDVTVRKPEETDTKFLNLILAFLVVLRFFGGGVSSPIDFDCELVLRTIKIHDELSDALLSPEFVAA